jgi:RAB protein geranylgeranyltransferase component A
MWNRTRRMCTFWLTVYLRYFLHHIGKKVLHIDRNNFYGGEGASVNLTNMWKLFRENQEPNKELGHNRDWNIDLIPKYIMYGGKLVKILLKTRVSRYLEWKRNLYFIQPLTVLMSCSSNKVVSSQREE